MIPTPSPPAGSLPRPSAADGINTALGQAFVDAIVAGDFDRLETLLAPGVRFRALIPDGSREASTAADARAAIEDWFGGTEARELVGSTVDVVGDRLALGYRLELTEARERRVVEQHVAAAVDGGQFRDLAIVCSGFRPLAANRDREVGTVGERVSPGDEDEHESPAFTPAALLDATGLSCATLTPTVRSAVLELDVGAVLEIVTDDPEAEEGLRSWTRLTGNELVVTEVGLGPARRFGIRRSPPRAAGATEKGIN
jgi:TusA-related sulfurtransferase